MIFDRANEYIHMCINSLIGAWDQRLNINAVWSALGPKLLTRVYDQNVRITVHIIVRSSVINADNIKKFPETVVKAVDVQYFYPVHYTETIFFSEWPQSRKSMQLKRILSETSYGIHLWHAKTHELEPDPNALYGELLKTYCPTTYSQWVTMRKEPNNE